jgi:hypothetical protein
MMATASQRWASRALAAVAALVVANGCGPLKHIPLPVGTTVDCLKVSDELEAKIEAGTDTSADRDLAYDKVRQSPCEGAGQSFGRAAVTGRVVQQKALLAANLVRDVETYARKSRDLDPAFRDYASTRMLGTLYVLAPAALLKHGDSETGLEMLETLAHDHPDVPENHLRLAEAYISLGDTRSARPQVCECLAVRDRFRRDDQQLLNQLFAQLTAGGKSLGCEPPRPAR